MTLDGVHVHEWDDEPDEFATYTPDPGLDEPMVIHECLSSGCRALKIERHLFNQGRVTLVYEVAEALSDPALIPQQAPAGTRNAPQAAPFRESESPANPGDPR